FLRGFAKLQKQLQGEVAKLAEKFQKLTAAELRAHGAGVKLERHEGQLDPRARTVRLGLGYRGVVLDAGDDQTFILTKVDQHQKIDDWMRRNKFQANAATGALEVIDVAALEAAVDEAVKQVPLDAGKPKLFAHRKDKEFRQLGVNEL